MKSKIISLLSYLLLMSSIFTGIIGLYNVYSGLSKGDKMVFDSYEDFSILYEITNEENSTAKEISTRNTEIKESLIKSMTTLVFEMNNPILLVIKNYNLLIASIFGIYALYYIVKLNKQFNKGKQFSEAVIKAIKSIGLAMIFIGVVTTILFWLNRIYLVEFFEHLLTVEKSTVRLINNYKPISFGIFFIVLGGIFNLISYSFKEGLKLKEENDLTV